MIRLRLSHLFLLLSAFQLFSVSAFSQDSITSLQAQENIGQSKTVTGTVMKVTTLPKTVVLDFDGVFPNAPFTAVIFNEKLPAFDKAALESYKDKVVSVSGKIALYKDKPQIILNDPSQIKLADASALPAAAPSPAAPAPATSPVTGTAPTESPITAATPEAKSPQPPSAGNLISNGTFNKGKKDWEAPADAEVIADSDSQVLKVIFKPGEPLVLKQEIKKINKDGQPLQASFSLKLPEGSKLSEGLKVHLGTDASSGDHFLPKITTATGSWQEIKWPSIKVPKDSETVFLILEIPTGEGSVLLDNFHLAP